MHLYVAYIRMICLSLLNLRSLSIFLNVDERLNYFLLLGLAALLVAVSLNDSFDLFPTVNYVT